LHPRDPHGQFATTGSTGQHHIELGTPGRTLTDREYEEHAKEIETQIAAALKAGLVTNKMYTLGGDGITYTPERAAQQKEVVDELLDKYRNVPADGKAIISGGLGGAGKSTVLSQFAGVDMSQYAVVNPDDIKELMVQHGMAPEVPGLTPMEAATTFHEESTFIAQTFLSALLGQRKNIIWDGSMSWMPWMDENLDKMRKAGYRDIGAVFVDIPVQNSADRALSRWREGLEMYRRGESVLGGRYMPPSVIKRNATKDGSSVNRKNFEVLKPKFDSWELWDNSVWGRDPVEVASSHPRGRALPTAKRDVTVLPRLGAHPFGQTWQEDPDRTHRADGFWAKSYKGMHTIKTAYRNRRAGRDPLDGMPDDVLQRRFKYDLLHPGNGNDNNGYTLDSLKADIESAVDNIDQRLANADVRTTRLYRGFRTDNLFTVGEEFDVDLASWTEDKDWAAYYAGKQDDLSVGKYPVIMRMQGKKHSVPVGALVHQREHLARGRYRVVKAYKRGMYQVVVVEEL
jgi:hypothetical protein